jgi:predicted TIM-barrel fold metal-dependent hydrolase
MNAGRGAGNPVIVDADVHCPSPRSQDLLPYLDDHWQEYIRWTHFAPRSAGQVYPSWTGMAFGTASESADAAFRDTLEQDVFPAAAAAVVQAYFAVESIMHPYLAPDLATAANRWLAAHWLDHDPRLRGSAMVAPQFADSAAAEVARISGDPRFVQVLVPARAMEPYGSHRYWPLWQAAAEHDLAVGVTYGGSVPTPGNAVNWMETFFEEYATGTQPFATHITSLVLNGVFERWPNLRFVFIDSGWTWLPALCWRLDKEWKEGRQEVPWVKEPPSEYVKRHMRFTTAPSDGPAKPEHLPRLVEHLPFRDMLLYSSDAPRQDAQDFRLLAAALDPAGRDCVLGSNAVQVYRLAPLDAGAASR